MTNHAIVHIGPMKAGTSALARYLTLAQSRNELPAGVMYPIGDLWFGRVQNIVKQDLELLKLSGVSREHESSGDPTSLFSQIDAALAAVGEATRSGPANTALFVTETAGANTTLGALASLFDPYFSRVTFVTLARRQDHSMPSIVAQRVKDWDRSHVSLEVSDYLASEQGFVTSIDYAHMVDEWSRPGSPLRVIPYVEGEQGSMESIRRFFRVLDLGEAVDIRGIEGRRIHPTFSRDGLRALGAIKHQARRWGWIPGYTARAKARFEETWKLYHAAATTAGLEPSGRKFTPYKLTASESAHVLARFAESNARLLELVDRTGAEDEWIEWEKSLGTTGG